MTSAPTGTSTAPTHERRTPVGADLSRPVPSRLRLIEPLASLALALHALAVLEAVDLSHARTIRAVAVVLTLLGTAGLLGAHSTGAVLVRGAAILGLGFLLQAVNADDGGGFFILWFFVLVSVYPLVLPPRTGRLVAVLTPAAYLALLPLGGIDGWYGIALLRALSLALIAAFVQTAATAYREMVGRLARSEASAQESLATLQQALLPAEVLSPPWVEVAARYRAAGADDQIGGDWYDTIALPTGGLALVIGDVEGHDLTAASIMGLVRGAVRSYALEGHPPSIVMSRVNAFLFSAGITRLITMAYIQLYPDDTTATVTIAGHPAPLVLPGDGTAGYPLAVPPGPVLGLDATCRWDERTVLLPRSASLALYTDGLIGTPRAPADQLERLTEQVRAAAYDCPQRLAQTLIATASGYDDAAVLVARVRSASAPSPQRSFPAQPISASIARVWIADLFGLWQSSGVVDLRAGLTDRVEIAQLLLTELVSNAVRHSDRAVRVQVEVVQRRLRVEVGDTSDRMPVIRQPGAADTEGRGLRLVDTLAESWGVRLDDRGKVVWFEIDLEPHLGGTINEEALLAAFADSDPG